jgi:hypothetical protein
MPYHLEKGVTLRLVEQHLNGDRPEMGRVLEALRSADSAAWVSEVLPGLWADGGFAARAEVGSDARNHLLRDWFGVDGAGDPGPGTGFWIAYRGDVERIVRTSLVWALELALGLERGADPATRADAGPPHLIELFWKCPAPWFEGWVVRRPATARPDGPALVTVLFVTPSHTGANVAESPVAAAFSALRGPGHPVPSMEDDYDQLDTDWAPSALAGRPRVPAGDRRYGTWVVTHADHRSSGDLFLLDNSARSGEFADWGIPQLNVFEGVGDVVVVSPSLQAGGATHDGFVPGSVPAGPGEG